MLNKAEDSTRAYNSFETATTLTTWSGVVATGSLILAISKEATKNMGFDVIPDYINIIRPAFAWPAVALAGLAAISLLNGHRSLIKSFRGTIWDTVNEYLPSRSVEYASVATASAAVVEAFTRFHVLNSLVNYLS